MPLLGWRIGATRPRPPLPASKEHLGNASLSRRSAEFDDPNLVSCAGLAPVLALAERCGLHRLVSEHVSVPGEDGANPHLKIPALVAGMVAGADSIDDMDLLRHGGTGRLFGGLRAPSTLGIFLRAFTFGHVRQLDAIAARFLGNLAAHTARTPRCCLELAVRVAGWCSSTSTTRSGRPPGTPSRAPATGTAGSKGSGVLIATASTPTSAPVVVGTRLRRGNVNSAKGAHRLLAEALKVLGTLHHRTGSASESRRPGLVLVRADSAYYNHDPLHRVHLQEEVPAGHRPAPGAAGQAAQPDQR